MKDLKDNVDWFEISDDDWLDSRFRGKTIKLLADSQMPQPVINEIAAAGINVEAMPKSLRSRDDPEVLAFAQQSKRVLLTLDNDFWDDRKHSLQSVQNGIIYVAESPDQHDCILHAFGLIYGCFARSYPLDWWTHMKVKGIVHQFEVKMRNWEGKVKKYRMKLNKGFLLARELE